MNLRAALQLGRVSNLPTVWTNVLAGLALAGAFPKPGTLIGLLVSMSLFYTGGMYLNDAFDRKADAKTRPERPIPSGLASASSVYLAGFLMIAAGVGIIFLLARLSPGGSYAPVVFALALAAFIVYYDAHHKSNPIAPAVMGLCRALVYVTVAAVAGGVRIEVGLGAAALMSYVIGISYLSGREARPGRTCP